MYRGTLAELAELSVGDADMTRGEMVIVVAGADAADEGNEAQDREATHVLECLLDELPVSQAARLAAKITGRSRKELYERALQLVPPARRRCG